jgi:hypothetical protein
MSSQDESSSPLAGTNVLIRRMEVDAHSLPDHSFLLFDPTSRVTIPVSESAGRIWELCDGSHTIDQIVDELAGIYDADRLRIDQDTRDFLAVLERHGFAVRRLSFE